MRGGLFAFVNRHRSWQAADHRQRRDYNRRSGTLPFEMLENRYLLSVSADTISATGPSQQQPIGAVAPQTAASHDGIIAVQTAAQGTITSVRDGLWSNPTTWSTGQLPGPSDDVVIANNVTIDQGSAWELDINAGTATLAGNLQAYGSVIVRSSLVGTQGSIFFHVADDRLVVGNTTPGPVAAMPDFHPQDVGLWALPGAHVDLEGQQVTSWLNAIGSGALQDLGHGVAEQVAFGAGNAMLQTQPVGWRPGDTLLLVNEQGQSLLADLVAVNGATIQYHEHKAQPTDPSLVGHELITQGSSTVVYSKIADLTRGIQIVSADVHEGDANHRAFTVAMDGASVNFVNVEFRDLGPRGKLGRYPVYFQDVSGATSKLTGSSIWQDVSDPGNRFVALGGVQGTTISSNVAYRSQGDGFFLEDSNDYGNTIANNLSVDVTGGEELPNADSNVTQLTQHYWLRTGNTISGNVAAGGDANGMIILVSSHPGTLPVIGTEVLGAGLFGMWTAAPNVTFDNPVAVYNQRAGFAAEPAWGVDSHGATLQNPLLLFNGTSDSSYGSQIYSNDGDRTVVDGGVLAGKKGFHTHYHSSITVSNAIIDVDTLLVPTYWEQAAIFSHDQIRASLLFESAYPSPRYASPGLVRIVDSQLQVDSGPVEQENADYMGSAFQNYPALQGTPIPNGIELIQPAPDSGFIRVTLLPDDERWMTNIARWTVTPIGQTPQANSFIYQRQTAWTNLAGFGGYPDGFPPGEYAVSLYTADGVFLKSGFAVVRSGQVSDITDTLDTSAQVVDTALFYNHSKFDKNTSGISASDDRAIAPDKTAYLPGSGAATFSNLSSFTNGINGVMVDLTHAGRADLNLNASDFTFRVGTNNAPSLWAAAPAPSTISVRTGAGTAGSDRVELTWPDRSIVNEWLEVVVHADANTGLSAPYTFFYGSQPGNSGTGDTTTLEIVSSSDESGAHSHSGSATLTNANAPFDYNRDGFVNSSDESAARGNFGEMHFIQILANTPLAPDAAPAVAPNLSVAPAPATSSGDSGMASGLASLKPGALPPLRLDWLSSELKNVNLNSGVTATIFEALVTADTELTRSILVKADKISDELWIDDALLD